MILLDTKRKAIMWQDVCFIIQSCDKRLIQSCDKMLIQSWDKMLIQTCYDAMAAVNWLVLGLLMTSIGSTEPADMFCLVCCWPPCLLTDPASVWYCTRLDVARPPLILLGSITSKFRAWICTLERCGCRLGTRGGCWGGGSLLVLLPLYWSGGRNTRVLPAWTVFGPIALDAAWLLGWPILSPTFPEPVGDE